MPQPGETEPAAQGLKGNPATTGKIFSDDNSYRQGVAKKQQRLITQEAIARQANKVVDDFTHYDYDKKSEGVIYSFMDSKELAKELKINKATAKEWQKKGAQVELLAKDETRGAKSIDTKVNGFLNEFKGVSSVTSVDNQLRSANEQCRFFKGQKTNVTLHVNKISKGKLLKGVSNRIHRCEAIDNLYLVFDKKGLPV